MNNTFMKSVFVNGEEILLQAKFLLPMGWIGYIKKNNDIKRVTIPLNYCHVSPDFEENDEDNNCCWTKQSVFRFLEKEISTNKTANYIFTEQGINYSVEAKFSFQKHAVGWKGYIYMGNEKFFVHIPLDKCHVSPSFEDEETDDNEYSWTKKSVLKYLHECAKKRMCGKM